MSHTQHSLFEGETDCYIQTVVPRKFRLRWPCGCCRYGIKRGSPPQGPWGNHTRSHMRLNPRQTHTSAALCTQTSRTAKTSTGVCPNEWILNIWTADQSLTGIAWTGAHGGTESVVLWTVSLWAPLRNWEIKEQPSSLTVYLQTWTASTIPHNSWLPCLPLGLQKW